MTPSSSSSSSPPPAELLLQADLAERSGDRATAASRLRAYLAVQAQARRADDGAVRMRLARLLVALAEPLSARTVLLPLDHLQDGDWAAQANRLLAVLDEGDGALTSAQVRWERALADDIDDVEAQSHLRALGPRSEPEGWPASLSVGTLAVPEGVRLSRFRMLRELGRGSSAAVYLVHDERLDLPLALKVLHPQLAATARAVARERFFAEARLAARLRHPGVVAIYDIDEEARCLAMEYIAGGTIRDRVRLATSPGRSSPDASLAVLAVGRSLLEALTYVHGAGVVHGDLKPGNVLLRTPGDVVLADFGVAELANTTSGAASDRAAGTPLYLAPEQFRGAPASVATDLFAAGAILWELWHGRPARRQSDLLAGQYAAPEMVGDAAPGADIDGGAPAASLCRLIAALLRSDPSRRPPSAAAALALLSP
ncbi:MAG: serine/threonine-protein kinase [Polyangia bacterium]